MKNLLTSKRISYPTRIRLAKCYVWSTLGYGSETWSLTSMTEKRIKTFEMWVYRRMARISWTERMTNEKVLEKIGIKELSLLTSIKKRRLQFYGHVRRHNNIQKTILEGKVNGKRKRGRRRRSWTMNIADDAGKPINECATIACDRDCWRKVVFNLGNETKPG